MNFKKYMIIALVVAIIMVLLAGFVYVISEDDATYDEGDKSNTPYMASSTYVQNAKFTENGIIFEYIETDQNGNQNKQQKTSKEIAKIIWDTLLEQKSNVNHYIDSAEELEKLMRAELVTQFPKLDKNVDLNGTVEFERHKTDGTSITLKYKDIATFNKYIEEKNLDIVNYFTLDGDGNVLIGIVDETTEQLTSNDPDMILSDYTDTLDDSNMISTGNYSKTTYNVLSKSIPYKSIVSKYTMPFQYLWSLIVVGGDKGVGLELAELVENSQIIISIYDNVTTTVNTTIDTYNREKKINLAATATAKTTYQNSYTKSDYWGPVEEWVENYEYEIKHVFTYKNNTAIIDVQKADVWIVDYSKEYIHQNEQQTSKEMNVKPLEDEEYKDDANNPVKSSTGDGTDLYNYDRFKDELLELKKETERVLMNSGQTQYMNGAGVNYSVFSYITSVEAGYYKHNVNKQRKNINEEFVQKYVAGNVVNNPKVEKNTGEKNFVTILCDIEHNAAKNRITREAPSWLFEMLENNPDTVNMVDLTSYLLYKVTGNKQFNTDYDFSIYEMNSFSSVGIGIYSGTIQEKVWFALKDLGYSDIAVAGAMGNIHYESGSFDPTKVEGGYTEETGGIGICQWTNNNRGKFGRNTDLRKYAESKGTTWQDEDIQVSFLIGELTRGGGADGFAKYQLMNTKSVYGSPLATPSAWENAESVEDATKAFCYTFERPGKKYAASSMSTRIGFAQMYYEKYKGMTAPEEIETTLTGDNKQKMELMIAEAIRIANDDRYQYSQSNRNAEFYYDCSSLVARLYQQYFGISRIDYGVAGRGTDNIKENCKNNTVSFSSLQAGDILWKDGHVALYIGNNQIVEAKNESKGIVVGTLSVNRFTYAFRVIK